MKKLCVFLAVLLAFSLAASTVGAEEGVGIQSLKAQIRKRPVSLFQYTIDSVDIWSAYLLKIVKTGNMTTLWNLKHKRTEGGFSVTLIEGFLHPKLDLVGGATVEKNELRHAFYGIEVELSIKGRLGKLLSRIRPGIHWSRDEWWIGASIALRGLSTQ